MPRRLLRSQEISLRQVSIVFVCVLALAWLAIEMTRANGWISSIWPVNGFVIAYMLRVPGRNWLSLLIATYVGSALAHILHNDDWPQNYILPMIGVLESGAIAYFIRSYTGRDFDLENYNHMLRFLIASVTIPVFSSIVAGFYFQGFYHLDFAAIAVGWFGAKALGLIVFTPLFYFIGWDEIKAFTRKDMRKKTAMLMSALVVVLCAMFLQNNYPLLFVVFPLKALISFWLGTSGAIIAIAVTTCFAIVATMQGYGPVSLINGDVQEKIMVLQIFLAANVVLSLPMAAALTGRERMRQSLIAATDAAEKANLAKSEFLTSMSHELRTPLNAISGFAQMLQANLQGRLSRSEVEYAEHIISGGEHLLRLINDVLDLSKIEAGKISISRETIPLYQQLSELEQIMRPLADKKKILLSFHDLEDLYVSADASRLNQVMINLVSNAIKYNRDHGRVEVTGEENGRMVRISVKDTGRGIPANRQHELFQSFNRLGAENSDIEGTGIGLAICERLVHAMDGKIGFESVEGAGSTFWIELPKAKPLTMPSSSENATIEKIPSRKRSRILYIEDNTANITLMQNLVENFMDADLIITRTGRSGLNEASFIRPDIIVSDIHLPDIDGREILKNLKKDSITANIPVIALTADASQTKDVGKIAFDHLLHKPYKVRDLVEIMNGILEKAA